MLKSFCPKIPHSPAVHQWSALATKRSARSAAIGPWSPKTGWWPAGWKPSGRSVGATLLPRRWAVSRLAGHYLLRSNLTGEDPAVLWTRYVQLTQIESVFRLLKSELGIRPTAHGS